MKVVRKNRLSANMLTEQYLRTCLWERKSDKALFAIARYPHTRKVMLARIDVPTGIIGGDDITAYEGTPQLLVRGKGYEDAGDIWTREGQGAFDLIPAGKYRLVIDD